MKRLNLVLLGIGAAIIFFGCEKTDPVVPDSGGDQEITAFKSAEKFKKTFFTGSCTPLAVPAPGVDKILPNGKTKRTGIISQWKDHSTDPLVAGVSTWYMDWIIEEDGITAMIKGKADVVLDDNLGKWELNFHGNIIKTDVGMKVTSECTGKGIDGEVTGMVAKWSHEMNYDFSKPETFVYNFVGYYY